MLVVRVLFISWDMLFFFVAQEGQRRGTCDLGRCEGARMGSRSSTTIPFSVVYCNINRSLLCFVDFLDFLDFLCVSSCFFVFLRFVGLPNL